MKAIRRFNNNVVLCIDGRGQEVVVFGKGLGFHDLPYEVELKKIEKSYYGIDERYMNLIETLSLESLDISRIALDLCREHLVGDINQNLVLTLADHIEFMVERYKKNMQIRMPLYYDFENMYPIEFEISRKILKKTEKIFKMKFPKDEIVGIGMSIVNSEFDSSLNQRNSDTPENIENITEIIEERLLIKINRNSGNYARYVSHMQYLMDRINKKELNIDGYDKMYFSFKEEYPEIADCANEINKYLVLKKNYKLNQDELLYLMIHINRLCSREECY